jgi:hypothetical protein
VNLAAVIHPPDIDLHRFLGDVKPSATTKYRFDVRLLAGKCSGGYRKLRQSARRAPSERGDSFGFGAISWPNQQAGSSAPKRPGLLPRRFHHSQRWNHFHHFGAPTRGMGNLQRKLGNFPPPICGRTIPKILNHISYCSENHAKIVASKKYISCLTTAHQCAIT